MRIGIDFDNTIVSYDELFHRLAIEKSVIPDNTPVNKVAVRDYLRSVGQEDIWTAMQGEVYGLRMAEARAYPGVLDFLDYAQSIGHETFIVSHKTKLPFVGPPYDLHEAAKAWVAASLCKNGRPLISKKNVYYELTKEEKIARIASLGCDVFIDDLPEILGMSGFPVRTTKFLFDPESHHLDTSYIRAASWSDLTAVILK